MDKQSLKQIDYLNAKKRTILIVEDEMVNQFILREILESTYDLLYAGDGKKALEMIREHAGDLSMILLDLGIPKPNGMEVLKIIKAEEETRDIPVIVMTSQTEVEEEMLQIGAMDFLSKPYDKAGIIKARISNIIRMAEAQKILAADLYDRVTGLLSMRNFLDLIEKLKLQIIEDNTYQEYALLYFNLINFKRYNSVYGIDAGDQCLRQVAEILTKYFENQPIARFADDHFVVLARLEELEEKLWKIEREVREIENSTMVRIKTGVRYVSSKDAELTGAVACDQAKSACDAIRGDADKSVCYYDESLNRRLALKSYIIENLDRALEKGYIKVYYQPVIRALTGKLCGMEALTRWIDPDQGFLSPGIFIPVLEEAHLIHKLDRFVIEEVARKMRELEDQGRPLLPVSFNLSRVDFLTGHPFETVEHVVREYRLHRNMLRCELTESTLMADKERMKEEIDRLHNGGYEVWMDDFGSGYSTLNIMKEFRFDEIKIDMLFLRNLNEQGLSILTSIVTMAKNLGIHTLAEGAETEDQVEFLKRIGCERIQGFFYGKPMPYEDLLQHCRDRGIMPETEAEAHIFDEAGLVNLNSDIPIALIWDDGKTLRPLVINDAYEETLRSLGTNGLEEMASSLASPLNPRIQRYRSFFKKAMSSGQTESMTYVDNGQFLRLNARTLASCGHTYIHRVELYNITSNSDERRAERFDAILRNAILVYKDIYLLDLDKDTREVLETTNSWEKAGEIITGVRELNARLAREVIYKEDQDEYLTFMDPDHLVETIEKGRKGFVGECFRVRQPDGNYKWMEIQVVYIHKAESRQILVLQKETSLDAPESRHNLARKLIGSSDFARYTADGSRWSMDGELWRNLMQSSSLRFFWKDRHRRFIDASQAFLDAYGLDDIGEIVGKTVEEVGWHIDNDPYMNDELDVVERGITIQDSIGQCVIQGVPHTISATKMPIYLNGKIIGLLGYFFDTESEEEQTSKWKSIHYKDKVTNLMNYRGITDAGLKLEEIYRRDGQDFIGILIDVPEYDTFSRNYGQEIGEALLRAVAEKIREHSGIDTIVARLERCRFMIFDKMTDDRSLRQRLMDMSNDIHAIQDVDGFSCTLYMQYTFAKRSEVSSSDAMLAILIERIGYAKSEDYARTLYSGERMLFDREKFDEMDERIYMTDPETYDLLYLNKTGLRDLGKPDDYDYHGKKCYEVLVGEKEPCQYCTNNLCRRDRFYTSHVRNPITGKDYLMRDTLISWRGKNARFSMGICLTEHNETLRENQEFIFREASINDAVNIAMREENIGEGIQKLLAKIGEDFKAERAYVFEDEGDRVTSNTYEWCKKGVAPAIEYLQHIPAEITRSFYQAFDKKEAIIIYDLEDWKERDPALYEALYKQEIRSLIAVPLKIGERELGYLGLDNPVMGNAHNISLMLMTLSKFVSFLLRDRDTMHELKLLGRIDGLTGVMNRRAFKEVARTMNENTHFAFIYGDVNGLKYINDTRGHEAGDRLIKETARIMCDLVGQENVYRMGGDEFLIVAELKDEDEADALLARLREDFDKARISVALGCIWKAGANRDTDKLLQEADRRMYLNKQYMHENDET